MYVPFETPSHRELRGATRSSAAARDQTARQYSRDDRAPKITGEKERVIHPPPTVRHNHHGRDKGERSRTCASCGALRQLITS